jgi:DinB family protein
VDREAAIRDFEVAKREWDAAFARVPDEALAYLKPGDDYSLGGLQVHVNWVLGHYRRVLDAIVSEGFGDVGPQDAPGDEDAARRGARAGLTDQDRWKSVQAGGHAHRRIAKTLADLPGSDWERKAPVVYAQGEDAYPTSAEDIAGWLIDHYREHITQTADLIEEWMATKAGG